LCGNKIEQGCHCRDEYRLEGVVEEREYFFQGVFCYLVKVTNFFDVVLIVVYCLLFVENQKYTFIQFFLSIIMLLLFSY
jgi:hypothetical protein